jgi:hypothetical protein
MQKIASPQDLQAELRRILALCQGPGKPSREVLATELRGLADRVAGSQTRKIPEKEINDWKSGLRRHKGQKGPAGLKFGQKFKYQGKDWIVYDFDADSKAPKGVTLVLVTPDFSETVRGVEVP